jgi:hypothetical protein
LSPGGPVRGAVDQRWRVRVNIPFEVDR